MAELSDKLLSDILSKLKDANDVNVPGSSANYLYQIEASSSQLIRDIKAHHIKLVRAINKGNKTSTKKSGTAGKADSKSSSKESVQKSKHDKQSANALTTISNHLKDIKSFLKTTFKKEGLSGSEEKRNNLGLVVEDTKKDKKKKDKEKKTSSLPWLSMLFAGGALAGITKVFGLGAGAGVGGGLLAKLLPKIFKVGKAVFKRIPIIGSLFSFYEAYKHFQKGGIDSIIFGLLDVVAGIAYMVPGIGTVIGLGVDVLSYFLQNKAEEYKEESGSTSFFGSLFDQVTTWLSETPPIKWLTTLGILAGELWANPSAETFMAFGEHLGGPLLTFVEFVKNLDLIAGEALGLENNQGQTVGLFEWIYIKIDEKIITPVKDFLTGLFDKIADTILSLHDKIKDWIGGLVSKFPSFMIPDSVEKELGIGAYAGGDEKHASKEAARRGIKTGAFSSAEINKKIKAKANRAGMSYEDFMSLDSWMSNLETGQGDKDEMYSGVKNLWQQHKFQEAAELRGQLMQKKAMETEHVPSKFDLDATLESPTSNQTLNNTSVNTTIHNEIHEPPPSDVFNPGFRYQFSRP
jgi:hypothetical protein